VRRTSATDRRARVDRRTKDLVTRLRAGDIVAIDHVDLDGWRQRSVEARVAAVVNASSPVSGRYPNPDRWSARRRHTARRRRRPPSRHGHGGQELRFGAVTLLDGQVVATARHTEASLHESSNRAAATSVRIQRRHQHARIRSASTRHRLPTLPDVREEFRGRHALVVVRGEDYRDNLVASRSGYPREVRLWSCVDGGADALLEIGAAAHRDGRLRLRSSSALSCGRS
jgi:hypothetical protein